MTAPDSSASAGTDGRRLSDPLLRVDGVTSGYGGTEVLRNVSFDIGEGEVVALIGRNGAGKTTSLRTILGNLVPSAGTISFDGEDITEFGPEETVERGISLVPEERRIFAGLTVRENLELAQIGGSESGVRREIHEVLSTFENLAENEQSGGSQLSGGEQQMLAIARALVGGARLLMLDEPTEGLAPLIVRRVEEVVEELSDEGLPILLVEQNVRVALDAADYVYVIDNGQIVHHGSAESVRENQELLDRYLGVSV